VYRRIMLAVDSSASSKRATTEAVRVATLAQATVLVVHVIDLTSPLTYGQRYTQTLTDAMYSNARIVLEEARKVLQAAGIASEEELIETEGIGDDVASCLLRCASRCAADLIVMGTHGRRGVRRLVLGSVAEHLLRFSPHPVLLIRSDERAGQASGAEA